MTISLLCAERMAGQPKAAADATAAPPINRPREVIGTCVIGTLLCETATRELNERFPRRKNNPATRVAGFGNILRDIPGGGRSDSAVGALAMKRLLAVMACLLAGCASAPPLRPPDRVESFCSAETPAGSAVTSI